MTINEFRAWLEGFEASFTCDCDGKRYANPSHYAKIKAKLAEVDGAVNTQARNTRDPFQQWAGHPIGEPCAEPRSHAGQNRAQNTRFSPNI